MSRFDAYFHAPHRAARSYLLAKVFLPLVALDTWLLMIGHAGRYGVDGFNVAHFRWLDAIAPLPSAGLYVGVLVLTGLLALAVAFGVSHRVARAALFVLYTYSWAMSMLDSYQHHYFVSSVLLCLVFFPSLSAADIHGGARGAAPAAPVLTSAFGFNLLGAIIAVLYTYTSVAKMDAQWLQGHTIRRISTAEHVVGPLAQWLSSLGLPTERFWSLFAASVIPLELVIAAGYLVAVRQDASSPRWARFACIVAYGAAMSLHFGAEALDLEIGWFSYYMLLLGTVFLLPGALIDKLATAVTGPARIVTRELADFVGEGAVRTGEAAITLALAGMTCALLCSVGYLIDLPGALPACVAAAATVVIATLTAVANQQARRARFPLLGTAFAGAVMWLAIAQSEVRWDFYRYLGGDLRRRGQPEAALLAYEKGERYAPKGQSRRDKINELKHQLGR